MRRLMLSTYFIAQSTNYLLVDIISAIKRVGKINKQSEHVFARKNRQQIIETEIGEIIIVYQTEYINSLVCDL
jgi:hypothetical protein